MVWVVGGTLYGQTDAGAIWNRTANTVISDDGDGSGLERCQYDPCVYSNEKPAGGRVTSPLYVDDGRVYFDRCSEPTANAFSKRLKTAFGVEMGPKDPPDDYFLGWNRSRDASGNVTITGKSYITTNLVARFADGDVSVTKRFPAAWSYTPADDALVKAHEQAVAVRTPPSPEFTKRYQPLFGALLHIDAA